MSSIWYDKKDARGHRVCHYIFDKWCMKCGCGNRNGTENVLKYALCEVSDEDHLANLPEKLAECPETAERHLALRKRMFLDEDTPTKTRFYSDFSAKYFQ